MALRHERSTAILVIAAWRERTGLRARVTYTTDDTGAEPISIAAGTIEQVEGIIEQWLRLVDQDRD